jgi:transposase
LRLGTLKPVYHSNSLVPALKELARSYRTLVSDTARVMNRLKALYRARGIRCAGTRVYSPRFRDQWREQLREPGARGRADLLYKQLDSLLPLRQEARGAMLAESHKHPAQKILCSIPALGPVRVALLLALLQTPYRFRGKRQLWTYAGLALAELPRSPAGFRRFREARFLFSATGTRKGKIVTNKCNHFR